MPRKIMFVLLALVCGLLAARSAHSIEFGGRGWYCPQDGFGFCSFEERVGEPFGVSASFGLINPSLPYKFHYELFSGTIVNQHNLAGISVSGGDVHVDLSIRDLILEKCFVPSPDDICGEPFLYFHAEILGDSGTISGAHPHYDILYEVTWGPKGGRGFYTTEGAGCPQNRAGDTGSNRCAFEFFAVAEPGTPAMLGAACAILVAYRLRRRLPTMRAGPAILIAVVAVAALLPSAAANGAAYRFHVATSVGAPRWDSVVTVDDGFTSESGAWDEEFAGPYLGRILGISLQPTAEDLPPSIVFTAEGWAGQGFSRPWSGGEFLRFDLTVVGNHLEGSIEVLWRNGLHGWSGTSSGALWKVGFGTDDFASACFGSQFPTGDSNACRATGQFLRVPEPSTTAVLGAACAILLSCRLPVPAIQAFPRRSPSACRPHSGSRDGR